MWQCPPFHCRGPGQEGTSPRAWARPGQEPRSPGVTPSGLGRKVPPSGLSSQSSCRGQGCDRDKSVHLKTGLRRTLQALASLSLLLAPWPLFPPGSKGDG